jgi:phosphoribosylanthranilate isomerase
VAVKICGLMRAGDVAAAAEAGADLLGFVFFPPSPRSLGIEEAARLIAAAPPGPARVALTVDADDATLDRIAALPVDLLQLHGSESPERVAAIRARSGRAVMKAIGIREEADLAQIEPHAAVADRLLLDAKPPAGASRPGGNALAFDWRLLAGRAVPCPWLLAGGLTPANVGQAVRLTGAPGVDVSSGVETGPGVKDPAKIRAFIGAARAAAPAPAP